MLENWNKDVTVFIRNETENKVQWEKCCFSHCFFKRFLSSKFDEKHRTEGESFIVRIPCEDENVIIPQKSIAVLGDIPDVIEDNTSGVEMLKKYPDSFIVNTVSDNKGFYMPHIRIGN